MKSWQFLLDDPPSNASTGAPAPSEGATEAPPPSLLSNPPKVEGDPAGAGAEGAPREGGEAPGPDPLLPQEQKQEVVAFDVAALTLPEGITFTEEEGSAFAEVLNGELSPQERGQKLVDLYLASQEAMNKAGQEAAVAAWNSMNEQWRTELRALPEFASGFEAGLGEIKQALTSLGAKDEFFHALDLTGAGNNPHVVQMLHKLTRPYVEGQSVGGEAPAVRSQATMLAAMYPSMQPKG